MNREQRRKQTKNLRKNGYNKKEAEYMSDLMNGLKNGDSIPNGHKVRLNYNKLTRGNPLRDKWCDEHKNQILTVQYTEQAKNNKEKNPMVVMLEEDESGENEKWLFSTYELDKVYDSENVL